MRHPEGTSEGRVVDAITGDPIEGAKVILPSGEYGITGTDGRVTVWHKSREKGKRKLNMQQETEEVSKVKHFPLGTRLVGGMIRLERFRDRFGLGAGIYIGSWGVHIYLDFWQWCLSFESNPRQRPVTKRAAHEEKPITRERAMEV